MGRPGPKKTQRYGVEFMRAAVQLTPGRSVAETGGSLRRLSVARDDTMRTWTIPMAVAFLIGVGWLAAASPDEGRPVRVTVDNFRRAESDTYFARFVKEGGFGKFKHERDLAPIDNQTVIRLNRDTLYSFGVCPGRERTHG